MPTTCTKWTICSGLGPNNTITITERVNNTKVNTTLTDCVITKFNGSHAIKGKKIDKTKCKCGGKHICKYEEYVLFWKSRFMQKPIKLGSLSWEDGYALKHGKEIKEQIDYMNKELDVLTWDNVFDKGFYFLNQFNKEMLPDSQPV